MSKEVLKNTKLYFGGYELSGSHNEIGLDEMVDELDQTCFNETDRTWLPGMRDAEISHSGFWEGGDGSVDEVLESILGNVDGRPFTACLNDGSEGEVARFCEAIRAAYRINGEFGGLLAFSGAARTKGGLMRGTVLASGAKTSSGNGTARQLGAVSADQKLYAILHCTAASGTSIDVSAYSADNESMTDATERVTFSQLADIGSEWATPVSGAITDDWWRIDWTIAGADPSFTILAALAII